MKVLYVESFYPQLSESYVACEIKYLKAMGVEIEVWSEFQSACPYPPQVHVYSGKLTEAIKASKPDIIHLHFLSELLRKQGDLEASGIPLTIRGHSVDHAPSYYEQIFKKPWLKTIWLYPHFVEKVRIPKVEPLPSCYDPDLYYPSPEKEKGLVVRACAGLPYKNIEEFIRVAASVPSKRFALIFAWNAHYKSHRSAIEALNKSLGNPVQIMINVPHSDTAAIVRKAEISIYSAYPESHPFGMPMSTIEGPASGSTLFVQDHKVPADIYSAATIFKNTAELTKLLKDTNAWDQTQWKVRYDRSVKAMERFSAPNVIPTIYSKWSNIMKGGNP